MTNSSAQHVSSAIHRVLLVHNHYRKGNPAGEDNAVAQEADLLRSAGVEVFTYFRSNDEVDEANVLRSAQVAAGMWRSLRSQRDIAELIATHRPDVAHFHNTFPLISASGYVACRKAGIPVVQTLHNYRPLCAAATLYRNGAVCRECSPPNFFPAIRHRCYRSLSGSAAVATMLAANWYLGDYTRLVDRYLVLTQFAAALLRRAGLPAPKIEVKPNFARVDRQVGQGGGGYAVFVGKFAEEKGVRTLLNAWRELREIPLRLVGTGPLDGVLRAAAAADNLPVEFCGMRDRADVLEILARAELLVVPSEWFEGFPLCIVEAYGCGTPVVAARIGGLPEVVESGVTGLLFEPGNAPMLAAAVRELWSDKQQRTNMRGACRFRFEQSFSPEVNLRLLLGAYSRTLAAYGSGPR